MSGRVAHQPARVKLVATAAILPAAWLLGPAMGPALRASAAPAVAAPRRRHPA